MAGAASPCRLHTTVTVFSPVRYSSYCSSPAASISRTSRCHTASRTIPAWRSSSRSAILYTMNL